MADNEADDLADRFAQMLSVEYGARSVTSTTAKTYLAGPSGGLPVPFPLSWLS